jgi:transcriptional regulator with XRE-family HTH domain
MKIKEIREIKGISQSELAAAIGTTQTNISRWEQGKNEPTSNFIILLANHLQTTTDYLLGRETEYGIVEIKSDLSLTQDENEILTNYRKLNDQGKGRLVGYLIALIENTKYRRRI